MARGMRAEHPRRRRDGQGCPSAAASQGWRKRRRLRRNTPGGAGTPPVATRPAEPAGTPPVASAPAVCASRRRPVRTGLLLAGLLLAVGATGLGAQAVRLAQIDSSSLLADQTVDLYVSVTGADGEPVEGLQADRFHVMESADGRSFRDVPRIVRFRPGANRTDGIHFLLLIDNSGSMYDTLEGQPTEQEDLRRITQAKAAVRTFLDSITNPRDTVGLATFNTDYRRQSGPTSRTARIGDLLDTIQRPSREQAYTELYAALTLGSEDLSDSRGRRVLVVLSDGENYPYAVHAGQPSPRFGSKVYAYTEPIEMAQREGISIFAINFGPQKDPRLEAIAVETGGAVFDAADRTQLADVYARIRERVRQEYRIGYRATMDPAERKYVRVEVREDGTAREATRFYFAPTVFGLPARQLSPLLILPFLLALALWVLLTRLKLEHAALRPSLEVLRTYRGRVSTRMFDLGGGKTVIGGAPEADLTISGVPSVKRHHATVLYDPTEKGYTIVGEGDITVNNRPTRRRKLEEGDVINVEGATIVFHAPPGAGEEKRPPRKERKPPARPGREGRPPREGRRPPARRERRPPSSRGRG